MNRRQLVFVILIVLVPTATGVGVFRAGVTAEVPAAGGCLVPMAMSDTWSVGVISIPFLVFGVLLATGYRHCVLLYRRWCCVCPPDESRRASGLVSEDDPGVFEGSVSPRCSVNPYGKGG